jgi:hypothetical protein
MFTKKYVGPVDCASCDKGIVNLYGKQAEKIHWNKLPFREPGERIAKVRTLQIKSNIFSMAKALASTWLRQPSMNRCFVLSTIREDQVLRGPAKISPR